MQMAALVAVRAVSRLRAHKERVAARLRQHRALLRRAVGVQWREARGDLLQELRDIAQNAVDGMSARRRKDPGEVCKTVRAAVSSYLFKHTKRSPMVIPMVTML